MPKGSAKENDNIQGTYANSLYSDLIPCFFHMDRFECTGPIMCERIVILDLETKEHF